jgi:hypothetical protein
MTLNLARRFAVVGVAVGVTIILLWWFDMTFNPFHLPTLEQAPPNYMQPLARRIMVDSFFVFCPGICLQMFTIGIGGWFSWVMWILAALLNAPIYYGIGLVIGVLLKRGDRVPAQ